MSDALTLAKHRLTLGLDREPLDVGPLNADQWVVKSLLQKSIRRGEVKIAQRAALTLLAQNGSALWKRFIVIAFEDVGACSSDVIAMTVAASTDARWRKQSGGDGVVAAHLARLLAGAPKSRSAEHLITSSDCHPSFEHERLLVSASSIADNLGVVADNSKLLMHRALAAWCVSGIDWKLEKEPRSDLPGLLDAYQSLGVPEELIAATGIAARSSREPITLMVPLVWLAANDAQVPTAQISEVPPSLDIDGVSMYALDKHTRTGREAIRALVKSNAEVRDCLKLYVRPAKWHEAAYMAAFYVDAAPLASKLSWDGANQLEALGTEADLMKSGVSRQGIQSLLQLFRSNVDQLNSVRADIFRKRSGLTDLGKAAIFGGEG